MSLDWNKLLSVKRRRPSSKQRGDLRSQFDRDFDRALFSTPVRRLQHKAQVFPLESNDSIRTRLTHSLEVSSIARTIARHCAPYIVKKAHLGEERQRDIEILCQTCGLLHDIGNPPFGHAGEEAIRSWFRECLDSENGKIRRSIRGDETNRIGEQRLNDFLLFDGNSQTFRILTRLQLVDNYAGLNLTFATLATLLKYTAPSHETNKNFARSKKHGYFFSENDIIAEVRKVTGVGVFRHPLTYIVEAADDIAYAVGDIEDALKKGVIPWDLLGSNEFKVLRPYKKKAETIVGFSEAATHHTVEEAERAYAARLRTMLITEMVVSVSRAFKRNYTDIMDGSMKDALEKSCDKREVIRACKQITTKYVYFAKETLKLEIMGRKVVTDLLNLYWEGVVGYEIGARSFAFPNKIWELLSQNYRHVFERQIGLPFNDKSLDYHLALHLVADHVCGMTDTFACKLHRELFNAS